MAAPEYGTIAVTPRYPLGAWNFGDELLWVTGIDYIPIDWVSFENCWYVSSCTYVNADGSVLGHHIAIRPTAPGVLVRVRFTKGYKGAALRGSIILPYNG